MSDFVFYEPKLQDVGAFHDLRGRHGGGYGWRGDRPHNQIKKITVHHTVTNPKWDMLAEIDEIASIHMNYNGWGGIGYHFIISTESVNGYAKVAYVGDVLSVRAHAINTRGLFGLEPEAGNYYFLGISIVGRFDTGHMPTIEQQRSLKLLISELLYNEDERLPELRSWDDVIAHKTTDYTACPGDWDTMKPLIMNIMVEDPAPTPKTMYEVFIDDVSQFKSEDLNEAYSQYEAFRRKLLDGKLELKADGVTSEQYTVSTKYDVEYSLENFDVETQAPKMSPSPTLEQKNIEDLSEAIRIYTALETRLIAANPQNPIMIRILGKQIIDGTPKEPEIIEQKEIKGRRVEFQVVVIDQIRDTYLDRERARVQYLNYVKDYKHQNLMNAIKIEVREVLRLVGFTDIAYDESYQKTIFEETVTFQEKPLEPSLIKSLILWISDIIKTLFTKK